MSTLFAYPRQTVVDTPVPKSKIYAHAQPTRALRERFVAEVDQILWAHKLAPTTLNLPAGPGVPEIEVFRLTLRSAEISEGVLRTMDRAIPFPTLFELCFEERVRCVLAYKRPSEAGGLKWVVDSYHETPWQPAGVAREPLPTAVDLARLYEEIVRRQLTLPARPTETLSQLVERANAIRACQAQCEQLQLRLRREPHFNRKVELNRMLRTAQAELDRLNGGDLPDRNQP
jgi:hypothetical protein